MQFFQLLVDFLKQVVQSVEILARVPDTLLGFTPARLVFGDAGGLFQEDAQIFGLGLDQARDHALLDNGVAARSKPRAEKDIGDVASAAAGVVQEIGRGAVARYLATNGNLVIAGILAADGAVAVVEGQFDAGVSHRLAACGTVEDDIGHRVAAQVLGGHLAHDPAHGIDNIGFTAAVWANHPDQIGG